MATTEPTYASLLQSTVQALNGAQLVTKPIASAMPDHGNTLIVGGRNSGKSTLLRALICQRWAADPHAAVVYMSATDVAKDAAGIAPNVISIPLVKDVAAAFQPYCSAHAALAAADPRASLVLMFDDFMPEEFRFCAAFRAVLLNGRHSRVSVVLACQYQTGIADRKHFDVVMYLDTLPGTLQRVCHIDTHGGAEPLKYGQTHPAGLPIAIFQPAPPAAVDNLDD